jgi:hypothetical protein
LTSCAELYARFSGTNCGRSPPRTSLPLGWLTRVKPGQEVGDGIPSTRRATTRCPGGQAWQGLPAVGRGSAWACHSQVMSESEARCANPRCPTHPIIVDDYHLPAEQRHPCPACGSRARAFTRVVSDSAPAIDSVSTSIQTHPSVAEATAVVRPAAIATANSVPGGQASVLPRRLTLLGLPATHELRILYVDLLDEPDPPSSKFNPLMAKL